jgi:hypothetical protein
MAWKNTGVIYTFSIRYDNLKNSLASLKNNHYEELAHFSWASLAEQWDRK